MRRVPRWGIAGARPGSSRGRRHVADRCAEPTSRTHGRRSQLHVAPGPDDVRVAVTRPSPRLRRTAVRGTSWRPGIRPGSSERWRNWAASASSRSMSGTGRCSDSSSPSTPPRWSTCARLPDVAKVDPETVMTAAGDSGRSAVGSGPDRSAALPLDHGLLLRRYWRRREGVRDRLRAAHVAVGVHRTRRQRLVLGLRRRHGDLRTATVTEPTWPAPSGGTTYGVAKGVSIIPVKVLVM